MISITLASTSKFKSEILNRVGLKHTCMASTCKETSSLTNPYDYVVELANNKALNIKDKASTDIIIGLDTIVLTNNKIIEKPKSLAEAKQNIVDSSSNFSKVITGISIINKKTNEIVNTHQETIIYFKKINDNDIDYYLENEPDIMYASGFIIENIASNFIDKIEGSYYNILGAPVEKIYEILNNMDVYLKDIN